MSDLLAMFTMGNINPGFVVVLAGFICALIPISEVRKALLLFAPVAAGVLIFQQFTSAEVIGGIWQVGPLTLTTLRIDSLAIVWGYIFCLAGVLNAIFGFHEKCKITDTSTLIYMGAAISAVFVGDLITLFIFWELTAISSVFLIWKGGAGSFQAGIRYLVYHVTSGVCLLAGAVIYGMSKGGDYTFDFIGLGQPGAWLILLGMGIKVGFPFLHNWIQDSYPKASITGTVILSIFTTKLALYALARGFPGTEILIYIGVVMACFPVFFAIVENDLRKLMAYVLNNQLGFMVCGIGIGSQLAMNGVAAQVVAHIIFESVLFMSIGAVMHRVGTAKASDLGGLFRSMPITGFFCLIGAASIAAVPLFAGFVTKSMIISSAVYYAEGGGGAIGWGVVLMLLFASVGVMLNATIKLPHVTFFAKDGGHRVKEAPWNMLVAMGLASALCIFIAWPWGGYEFIYSLLPYEASYKPYTFDHVVFQLQLVFAAILAFAFLKRQGFYLEARRAQILDFDWIHRKLFADIFSWTGIMWTRLSVNIDNVFDLCFRLSGKRLHKMFSPAGAFSAASPSGLPAIMTGAMLALAMIVIFLAAS